LTVQRETDFAFNRERNLVERLFSKVKGIHAVRDRKCIGRIAGAQENGRGAKHLARGHEVKEHLLALRSGLADFNPPLNRGMANGRESALTEYSRFFRYSSELCGLENGVERFGIEALEQIHAFQDRGIGHCKYLGQGALPPLTMVCPRPSLD
jgi:hypothetical protein